MHTHVKAACRAILLVAGLLAAAGCASKPLEGPPLRVGLSLDGTEHKIGDPVVATVTIYNRTGHPITLASFSPPSVTFYTSEKDGIRRQAYPVQPTNAEPNRRHIAAHKHTRRRFVFTRVTNQAGEQAMIARVTDCTGKDERFGGDVAVWYGEPVTLTVADAVSLRRDPHSGILAEAQAVACARKHLNTPEAPARAVLVPYGETGLVEWSVFIERDGEETALWVNAYTGAVRPLTLEFPTEGEAK